MSQASVTLQHYKCISKSFKCKSNVDGSPKVAFDTCSPIQYVESFKDEKNKS